MIQGYNEIELTLKVKTVTVSEISVHELKHVSLTCHALNNAVCKYVLTDASKRFAYEVEEDEGILQKRRSNSYAWGSFFIICSIENR